MLNAKIDTTFEIDALRREFASELLDECTLIEMWHGPRGNWQLRADYTNDMWIDTMWPNQMLSRRSSRAWCSQNSIPIASSAQLTPESIGLVTNVTSFLPLSRFNNNSHDKGGGNENPFSRR